MRLNNTFFTVLLAVLLAGCTQNPPKPEIVGPGSSARVDEAAVNAIYAEIERASAAADEALNRGRDGDGDGASVALTVAREAFTAAAGRCVATPGCDIERVLSAQDAVIERQAQELLGASEAQAAPADEAAPEAAQGSPVVRAMPHAARAVSLLKGKDLRGQIALNDPVKAALEEWLTWMRPNLLDAWENYQYMRHRMWPHYEQAGLPEALLFGILAKESGGKVHAVSRAGASGPLQFMPYTGLRHGLGSVNGFDMRFDPSAAARANVAYLNEQFAVLNDNLELALGAYNGGEGRMQRLSPRGSKSFWDPAVFNRLPPETREYVPMVLAAALLFLHPEDYNLELTAIDTRAESLAIDRSLSLNELSVCMGQIGNPRGWFRTLRNLNPRYDPNLRLPVGTQLDMPAAAAAAYRASCVDSPVVARAMALHDAKPPVAPVWTASGRTHVVRQGETLSAIARKFGCGNVRAIAQANRIKPPRYAIRAGQKLVVPACA